MSASPSGMSNGQGRTPKEGGPPGFVRRPRPADPLRPRKKPVRRPAAQPPRQPPTDSANGYQPPKPHHNTPNGQPSQRAPAPPAQPNGLRQVGWSTTPTGRYQDYPLITTKRSLREGLRYHVAKFTSKKNVDPTDQNEFTRPVLLHRRDPRQPPPGKATKDEEMVDVPLDSKEQEKQEILKAEKERQRAEDLALIAPTGNNAAAMATKKNQPFKNEKTTQVHRLDKTAEEKKASDLRYEEALPWHLEDADNKNTWVGNYEAALSGVNCVFVITPTGFRIIPVEKWYKFTSKAPFKTFTIEEAEAQMNKKVKESRWVMKTQEEKEAIKNEAEARRMTQMFTVKGETQTFKSSTKRETEDMDELDFAADDLFQDDDEQPGFDPDDNEDIKDVKEKIKREQLGANVFGNTDEHDVDAEFAALLREKQLTKVEGKKTRKALKKRERNLTYESDSDNPYSEASDDDTSDEEKQAEIDRKKDEEAKAKAKLDALKAESKLPSGASSKGTNTPSGRPKHSDPLKKANILKRPGSPNLSESSGNESSRKKKQKKMSSSHPTGSSTPIGSRAHSPAPGQAPRKSSIVKLSVSGERLSEINSAPPNPSMSDGEATGGEMSDGARKKKVKLRLTNKGSPTGSRAGSPAPGRAASGSRAGSPQAQGPRAQPSLGPIQPTELKAAIPATGITIQSLMKVFSNRIGDTKDKTERKKFIDMVKQNAEYGPDKLLRAK